MRKNVNWWRGHFTRESLLGYGLERKTAAEVRGVLRLLRPRPGARILDLCCGAGRHSVPLAEKGFQVTGVDLSAELLAAAETSARTKQVPLALERRDMRRLGYVRRFDAVINVFTSFGYFAKEEDDRKVLREVRRALKPGGRFLIDLLNKEWLMRHFTPAFQQRERGSRVRRIVNRLSYDFAEGKLDNRRTLIGPGSRRKTSRLLIRVYTLVEFIRLLRSEGLRFERAFGGLDGRPYAMDSFRMVVLARR